MQQYKQTNKRANSLLVSLRLASGFDLNFKFVNTSNFQTFLNSFAKKNFKAIEKKSSF